MSGPFTLRIVRPYGSRDDFLAGDFWTVERSEMLLVGVEGVAPGAQVQFEIVLENREIVVRGEGRALELVSPRDGRPGGVRVRFKQLDAGSKATLRRALEIQKKRAAEKPPADATPVGVQAAAEPVKLEAPKPQERNLPKTEATAEAARDESEPAVAMAAPVSAEPEREEPSGVHHRLAGPVRAPENREALLERLRERTRLRKASLSEPKSTAAAE